MITIYISVTLFIHQHIFALQTNNPLRSSVAIDFTKMEQQYMQIKNEILKLNSNNKYKFWLIWDQDLKFVGPNMVCKSNKRECK